MTTDNELKPTSSTVISAENEVKPLDNRTFGLIFAGIFLIIAAFPLLWGNSVRMWSLIVAAIWAALAIVLPFALTPLNRLWAKFGFLMHKITNPLLMGLVFFLTVVPTGIILKLLRKDPMNRKQQRDLDSYWIKRENSKITPEFFDQQF